MHLHEYRPRHLGRHPRGYGPYLRRRALARRAPAGPLQPARRAAHGVAEGASRPGPAGDGPRSLDRSALVGDDPHRADPAGGGRQHDRRAGLGRQCGERAPGRHHLHRGAQPVFLALALLGRRDGAIDGGAQGGRRAGIAPRPGGRVRLIPGGRLSGRLPRLRELCRLGDARALRCRRSDRRRLFELVGRSYAETRSSSRR